MCGGLDPLLANMGPVNPVPDFGHLSGFLTACWGLALAAGMVCGGLWLLARSAGDRGLQRRPDWGLWAVLCLLLCFCLSYASHSQAEKERYERYKQGGGKDSITNKSSAHE